MSHWAGPLHARWDAAPEDELRGAGPVSVAGRVMSLRHHGKSCFAHVLDQTGSIQLYARADVLGEGYAGFTDLDVADFVGVTGDLMRTRTGRADRPGEGLGLPVEVAPAAAREVARAARTSRPATASATWTSW